MHVLQKWLSHHYWLWLILPLILSLPIIFGHTWIPKHDTLQYSLFSHWFFSDWITSGEIPLWHPYIEAGSDQRYYYPAIMLHPSLIVLSPLMFLFKSTNFLTFIYLSNWIDEWILLFGTFLLARINFRTKWATLFVSYSVLVTSIWHSQIFLNFHAFYTLPMALYLVQTGVRRRAPWRLIASLLITWVGKNLHLMQLLLLFIFFCSVWFKQKAPYKTLFQNWGKREFTATLAFCLSIALSIAFLKAPLVPDIISPGRSLTGNVPYSSFLEIAQDRELKGLKGVFDGLSETFDSNTFGGIFILPFALISLFYCSPLRILGFLIPAIFTFLFYLGADSFVSPVFQFIPGFKLFFRHSYGVMPFFKFFLIFLAGFGFESLINHRFSLSVQKRKIISVLGCYGLILSAGLWWFGKQELIPYTRISLIAICFWAGLLLVSKHLSRPKLRETFSLWFIAIVFIDVLSYRFYSYNKHFTEFSVNQQVWELFNFSKMQYIPQRISNYFENSKFLLLAPYLFKDVTQAKTVVPHFVLNRKNFRIFFSEKVGATYNVIEPIVGIDPCATIFRSDVILPETRKVLFQFDAEPTDRIKSIIGCNSPKIKVFDQSGLSVSSSIKIQSFSSNHLKLSISPINATTSPLQLYYADSWHPNWHALLNDKSVPIRKAFGAFKAIDLPDGNSSVEFHYTNFLDTLLIYLYILVGYAFILSIMSWGIMLFLKSIFFPQNLFLKREPINNVSATIS